MKIDSIMMLRQYTARIQLNLTINLFSICLSFFVKYAIYVR